MEIEVKVLEVDRNTMIRRLLELGAEKVFDGIIESYYWGSGQEMLRIRKIGERCLVTYKRRLPDTEYKRSVEIEFFANDCKRVVELFEALGFRFTSRGRKHRTIFRLKNCEIAIDTILFSSYAEELGVREIPTYMEIEGEEEDIGEVIDLLGIDRKRVKPFSTRELIEYYARGEVGH